MSETCDVGGCSATAVVEMKTQADAGENRCRNCLEYDLQL